jgi:hypothetical protein
MAVNASSMQLIRDTVRNEREAQLRHADALDAKAGVVVGFSGVIAAASAARDDSYLLPGLCAVAFAALFGLFAFVPRKWPTWDLQGLRERYAAADTGFTERKIVDGEIVMAGRQRNRINLSASVLKLAIGLLFLGVVLLVGGSISSQLGG